MAENIITEKHTVRLSEVGPEGTLRPVALMNLLQEIADEHATQLGFGFDDLTSKQMTWMAARYHIQVNR